MKNNNIYQNNSDLVNRFDIMPNEVTQNIIFSNLNEKELLNVSTVCSQFKLFSQDNSVWKNIKEKRGISNLTLMENKSERLLVLNAIQKCILTFGPIYHYLALNSLENKLHSIFTQTETQEDLNNYLEAKNSCHNYTLMSLEEQHNLLPNIFPKNCFEAENFLIHQIKIHTDEIDHKEGLVNYLNCEMTTEENLTDLNVVKLFFELGADSSQEVIEAAKDMGASNNIMKFLYLNNFCKEASNCFGNNLLEEVVSKIKSIFDTFDGEKIVLTDSKIVYTDVNKQKIYNSLAYKFTEFFKPHCENFSIKLEIVE